MLSKGVLRTGREEFIRGCGELCINIFSVEQLQAITTHAYLREVISLICIAYYLNNAVINFKKFTLIYNGS